jgi:hypothetical protein
VSKFSVLGWMNNWITEHGGAAGAGFWKNRGVFGKNLPGIALPDEGNGRAEECLAMLPLTLIANAEFNYHTGELSVHLQVLMAVLSEFNIVHHSKIISAAII